MNVPRDCLVHEHKINVRTDEPSTDGVLQRLRVQRFDSYTFGLQAGVGWYLLAKEMWGDLKCPSGSSFGRFISAILRRF